MRSPSSLTPEKAPTLNTKCFCFVFPLLAVFPPRCKQRRQQFYEPMTAKRFWRLNVFIQPSTPSLGSAQCEGTMRQFKRIVCQFGSTISFSRTDHQKSNVRILWTKPLNCFMPFKKSHKLFRFWAICYFYFMFSAKKANFAQRLWSKCQN